MALTGSPIAAVQGPDRCHAALVTSKSAGGPGPPRPVSHTLPCHPLLQPPASTCFNALPGLLTGRWGSLLCSDAAHAILVSGTSSLCSSAAGWSDAVARLNHNQPALNCSLATVKQADFFAQPAQVLQRLLGSEAQMPSHIVLFGEMEHHVMREMHCSGYSLQRSLFNCFFRVDADKHILVYYRQ